MNPRQKAVLQLTEIPGVGNSIANDLWNIGITSVMDLKGRDPQELYDLSNKFAGVVQDPCLLYVFRCAVYYASTDKKKHDPEKLKWWNWKLEPKSETKPLKTKANRPKAKEKK